MTQDETSHASPAPSTRDRTWPVVVGVFLAFWVVYLLVAGPRALDEIDPDAPGKPAEYNWTLHDLDGRPVKFSAYEGKAVFLNIWATWCPPCVAEMPSIARLAGDSRWQGKNIAFVCAATDDSVETVRKYVSDKKWPMTILHVDGLPGAFLTDGIPATFIISPDGRVVASTEGSREWDVAEVMKSLEAVAAIPPRKPAPAADSTPSS